MICLGSRKPFSSRLNRYAAVVIGILLWMYPLSVSEVEQHSRSLYLNGFRSLARGVLDVGRGSIT